VKNILVPVIALLILSGCSTPAIKLIAPEYKVVSPPESLYNCPQVNQFKPTGKLTNEQVGQLILKLQKNNMICKDSLDNIHKYIDEAKANIEKKG
jgi:hypothetical protein